MPERIFLFGASGHGKVVIDAARRQGYAVEAIFDDNPALAGTTLMGCPVHGGRDALLAWSRTSGIRHGLVAIGQNGPRGTVAGWLKSSGLHRVSVVHPHAVLSAGIAPGPGSVVMAGVVINPDTTIGHDVIINTGATVDHDCVLGDLVHIGPGCHLCGGVRIGEGSLVGAGSTIIPGIRVGRDAVIGAGSTVIRDVPDGARVAGSPARPLA